MQILRLPNIGRIQTFTQIRLPAVSRTIALAIGLFTAFAAMFAYVQYGTPDLADNDGYYHMRFATIMRAEGLTPTFPWLPLSILNQDAFYNHHMFYHMYLGLFSGDGQPEALITGAKLASILMPSLAFLAIWWLLRGQGLRWAAIWAFGLFALSEAFLYRMSMPRAQSASLLTLALGLHILLLRRYALLLPLGFFYVWLYNAFPLLLAVAGAYIAATLLTERRLEWRALVYPVVGIGLGLIINPYFPDNLIFIAQHLLPKISRPETSVGNEWYPYETWTLIENSGVALAAWVLGALALGWRTQRIDRPTLTAFFLSVGFGFLLFKSRRFVEYFPPFAFIFLAMSVAPLINDWSMRISRRQWLCPLLMAGILALPLVYTLPQARAAMATSKPAETYAAASAWLRVNAPQGSVIFQTDWDDFPRLFFYNTDVIYTIGLDPTYMQLYDPELYDEWVAITRGKIEQPGRRITQRFGATYALSDLKHTDFLRQAERDPYLEEVYRDRYAVIYRVGTQN